MMAPSFSGGIQMISFKKTLFVGSMAAALLGFGLTASAQQTQGQQDPQDQAVYYGAPCMMDGFYQGAPVTSQYPVMMGFYCPYHGMYHFRPVYLPTQQQQQIYQQYQQAPQTQTPQAAAPQTTPQAPAQQTQPQN